MRPAFSSAISMNTTSFSSSSTRRIVWGGNVSINSTFAQPQPEPAALAQLRFHAERAVHPLRRFAHDGQPDPGAFVVLRPADAGEDLPDALVIARVDADAVVVDPQPDVALD